jgi:hypothetical protein
MVLVTSLTQMLSLKQTGKLLLAGELTSGDSNLISGTIDSISSGVSAAWDWTKSLFGF